MKLYATYTWRYNPFWFWPLSKGASIPLHLQSYSFNLTFLEPLQHLSGQWPPIFFLVLSLLVLCGICPIRTFFEAGNPFSFHSYDVTRPLKVFVSGNIYCIYICVNTTNFAILSGAPGSFPL